MEGEPKLSHRGDHTSVSRTALLETARRKRELSLLLFWLRSDRPLGALEELPGNLDRLAGQHQLRRIEENFLLPGGDLSLDNLDGQVFLLSINQPGDAIPDTDRTLVGVHAVHASQRRWRASGVCGSVHGRML